MISRVTVEAFKSISRANLELGQVNVFVGPNGVGKSNLLEAIGVLGAAADGLVDDASLLRRGVRPGLPAIYKSSFARQRAAPQIGLSAESAAAHYSVALRNPQSEPLEAWCYAHEAAWEGSTKVVGRSESRDWQGDPTRGLVALRLAELPPKSGVASLIRELRAFRIYTPDTHTLRGLVVDSQQQEPVGLSGGRLAEAVAGALKSLGKEAAEARETVSELLDWVESFDVVPASDTPMSRSVPSTPWVVRFRDRYMADKRKLVSGYDASEGALIVLFLLVLGLHPAAPMCLAVDNADHGLNPRLARRLMAELSSWILRGPDRQVLLTVHNPSALDGLPLLDDRVRLFTVDRTRPKGHTVFRRIEVTPELLDKAKEGWSLSRMWVSGLLGGVPDV